MRVVDRKTFLAMPAGTIYAKGEPWAFGNIMQKGETLASDDWIMTDFGNVDGQSSEEVFDRLEKMLATGVSFLISRDTSRDGLFEPDAIFLIYEFDDLVVLNNAICRAMARERGESLARNDRRGERQARPIEPT